MIKFLPKIVEIVKRHYGIIILLIGLMFVYHAWFFDLSIRTHGDWMFSYKETLETLRAHYFTLWLSDYSFGRVLVDVGQAPTYALYGFFAILFNADFSVSERLVHFWPAVLIAPLGAYLLCNYILKSRTASLIGAIVYACNTYALILHTGHLTLAGAYAVLPLVMLSYMHVFEARSVKSAVIAGLLLSVCGAYEPRAAYVAVGLLFFYAAFYCIKNFAEDRSPSRNIANIVLAGLPILVYVLTNLYWIIGLLGVKDALGESVLNRDLFGSAFQSIIAAFTLNHPFWNFAKPIPFVVNMPPFYFWLIPVLAFSGFYLYRKNYKIVFFGLVALVGIILTKQVDQPFTGLYGWLFTNVPGFSAFREASKFYFLIALAYSVLIAACSKHIFNVIKLKKKSTYLVPLSFMVISLIFLPNLIPIATQKIGTNFADRTVPADYLKFRDYVLSQPDFFRVLWLPRNSRWSVQTSQHPLIDSTKIVDEDWKGFVNEDRKSSRAVSLAEPLTKSYSNGLLDTAAVKYVVVPIRDSMNDDDFFVHYGHDRQAFIDELNKMPYLEKIDIGTKQLAVYENKKYNHYFSAADELTQVQSTSSLENIIDFQESKYGKDILSFTTDKLNVDIPKRVIKDAFYKIKIRQNNDQQSSIIGAVDVNPKSLLYVNEGKKGFSYQVKGSQLDLRTVEAGAISNGGEKIVPDQPSRSVASTTLNGAAQYLLGVGDEILKLNQTDDTLHKIAETQEQITLYKLDAANILSNPSFESGLWQSQVSDCNRYGELSNISMKLSRDEHSNGTASLELSTKDHTACTSYDSINVAGMNNYALAFDYMILEGKLAGYQLDFNDAKKTTIKQDLVSTSEAWIKERKLVSVPYGATKMKLTVKAFPDDRNLTRPKVYYDNFMLNRVIGDNVLLPSRKSSFNNYAAKISDGTVDYTNENFSAANLIKNPSLEDGLWRNKVGDCDNYDNYPKIKMSLNDKTKSHGGKSLELSSARHIACTGPQDIKVKENTYYQLNFDYQSPNAKTMGYNISFDDPKHTTINKQVNIKNSDWTTETKLIKSPSGSNKISLLVYSYSGSANKYATNRYDNFSLIEVPDIVGKYYSVSEPVKTLDKPRDISFRQTSTSNRIVDIKGAKAGFFLTMSEKYHPQWTLNVIDENGKSVGLVPQDMHIKYNDYMNAWYIDKVKVCGMKNACKVNADGSVDMQFSTEFTPQNTFNKALIVSGLVTLGSIVYISLGVRKRGVSKYIKRIQ